MCTCYSVRQLFNTLVISCVIFRFYTKINPIWSASLYISVCFPFFDAKRAAILIDWLFVVTCLLCGDGGGYMSGSLCIVHRTEGSGNKKTRSRAKCNKHKSGGGCVWNCSDDCWLKRSGCSLVWPILMRTVTTQVELTVTVQYVASTGDEMSVTQLLNSENKQIEWQSNICHFTEICWHSSQK